MTYSICCPEYFNLSSNPATSFFSLFTLLMRGLNEDNTTGLCFKMAGGHGFKACMAQRGRQPPQLPLISALDLCRAAKGISFPQVSVLARQERRDSRYSPSSRPTAGLCCLLSVNVCFLSLAFGKNRLQVLWNSCCCWQGNGCTQDGSQCLGCHLPPRTRAAWTSAVGKTWVFLTRQHFLHHAGDEDFFSYCVFPGRAICTKIRQMFICINERLRVVLHLLPMCWCKFILLHGKSLG